MLKQILKKAFSNDLVNRVYISPLLGRVETTSFELHPHIPSVRLMKLSDVERFYIKYIHKTHGYISRENYNEV